MYHQPPHQNTQKNLCTKSHANVVQDFLDKAKKDFEEKWAKNPQVSQPHGLSGHVPFLSDSLSSLITPFILDDLDMIEITHNSLNICLFDGVY